jgi:hypothetical protein
MLYDIASWALGHTVEIAFRYLSPDASYLGYSYWFVDNFEIRGIPELRHCWGESEPYEVIKTIRNVWPGVYVPEELPTTVPEATPILFEGLEITDPALLSGTEEIWYRIDMGDGTPVGDWIQVPPGSGIMYEDWEQDPALWPWSPWNHYAPPDFEEVHDDAAHDGDQGLEIQQGGYQWTYRTDLSLGVGGDKLSMWIQPAGGPQYETGRAYLGFGADSVGAYEFVVAPNTNELLIYDDYPYGSFSLLASTPYTFTHVDWYRAEVEFISSTEVICRLFDTDGTTLLADVSYSGSINCPGGISFRVFNWDVFGRFWYLDTYDNGAPAILPEIPAFSHTYGDNGIYFVDVMAIDDDMWWDLSGPQPVFVGPNDDPDDPGADPEDWIAHNEIPIEVLNVDPELGPIEVEISMDLSLRVTGEPDNPTTMTLLKGGSIDTSQPMNPVEISHQGNQQVVVMPVTLNMLEINDYSIEVSYVGSGGGANPSWVFQGRFGSGHIKELKRVFKDGMDPWLIGPQYLKEMIVGEDMTFSVTGDDVGSDDLGFVWNFGTIPHGVNVYANTDPTTAVPGVSTPLPLLFGVLPDPDPWFDRDPENDERSPWGTSIHVDESITHAFEEGYLYQVMLTCADDDCEEDPAYLPNEQGHAKDGIDMEQVTVDLA